MALLAAVRQESVQTGASRGTVCCRHPSTGVKQMAPTRKEKGKTRQKQDKNDCVCGGAWWRGSTKTGPWAVVWPRRAQSWLIWEKNTKNLELENEWGSQPARAGQRGRKGGPASVHPEQQRTSPVSITACPSGRHSNAKARPGTLLRLHPVGPAVVSPRAQPFMHRMSDGSSLVGFVDISSIGLQSCMFWSLVSQVQVLKVRVPMWGRTLWFSMRSSRWLNSSPLRVSARDGVYGGVYGEIVPQPLLPV